MIRKMNKVDELLYEPDTDVLVGRLEFKDITVGTFYRDNHELHLSNYWDAAVSHAIA